MRERVKHPYKNKEIYLTSNLQKDPVDSRDFIFDPDLSAIGSLPTYIDMREFGNSVEDQKTTGSCVANSAVSALEIILEKGGKYFDLSRLFLYYNIREPYESLKEQDKGAYLRDAFKSVSKVGICSEKTWPFNPSAVNVKPEPHSYSEAANHLVTRYERIDGFGILGGSIDESTPLMKTKAALASGYPVIFSAIVSSDLPKITGTFEEQYKNPYRGIYATNGKTNSIGGHAMCIVGYDDSKNSLIVENSWGTGWGHEGHFLLPYSVFLKDTNDVWVCTAFNGIELQPLWIDTEPPLVVEDVELKLYRGESKINLKASVKSGTPPYSYKWGYDKLSSTGIIIGPNSVLKEESIEFEISPNWNDAWLKCVVRDSSVLKKSAIQRFHIQRIDEERPKPAPEPEPIPEPVKPKEKESFFKKFLRKFKEFLNKIF